MWRETVQRHREIPVLLWKLLGTQFLMNASHFMAMPLLAIYLTGTLRFGPAELGTVMTANLISAQLLPLATGPIADRFGFRRLMVTGLLLRAVGLVGIAAATGWIAMSGMALVMGSGVACYESAVYGLLGRQPQTLSARVFVVNNQMLNLGVVVGPLLAGLAAFFDIRLAFIGSGCLFALLSLWASGLHGLDEWHDKATAVVTSLRRVVGNRNFLLLLAVSTPWWFLFAQLYVSFPIHLSRLAGEGAVPSIYLINGVVGFVFMLVAALLFMRAGARAVLSCGFLAASILFAGVPLSMTAWWFLIFVALYTVVETMILPSIEILTAEMAHDGSQSTFFAALSLAAAIGGTCGYYAGSWLILEATPELTWLTYSGVGALGLILSIWFSVASKRRAPAVGKIQYEALGS